MKDEAIFTEKIVFRDVDFDFNGQQIFSKMNMELPSTGFVAFLGRNGSGKTTFFRLLMGLISPSSGNIYVNGIECRKKNYQTMVQKKIGYFPQDYALIPNLSVIDNIRISVSKEITEREIEEKMKEYDLYQYKKTIARKLSSGEKQKVLLLISLFSECEILLLDEATANLSEENSAKFLKELKRISQKKLILFISHFEEEIKTYANEVYRLEEYRFREERKERQENENEYETKKNPKRSLYLFLMKMTIHNKGEMIFYGLIFLLMTFCLMMVGVSTTTKTDEVNGYLSKEKLPLVQLSNQLSLSDSVPIHYLLPPSNGTHHIAFDYKEPVELNLGDYILSGTPPTTPVTTTTWSIFYDYIGFTDEIYLNGKIHKIEEDELVMSDMMYQYYLYCLELGETTNEFRLEYLDHTPYVFHKITVYNTPYSEYFEFYKPTKFESFYSERSIQSTDLKFKGIFVHSSVQHKVFDFTEEDYLKLAGVKMTITDREHSFFNNVMTYTIRYNESVQEGHFARLSPPNQDTKKEYVGKSFDLTFEKKSDSSTTKTNLSTIFSSDFSESDSFENDQQNVFHKELTYQGALWPSSFSSTQEIYLSKKDFMEIVQTYSLKELLGNDTGVIYSLGPKDFYQITDHVDEVSFLHKDHVVLALNQLERIQSPLQMILIFVVVIMALLSVMKMIFVFKGKSYSVLAVRGYERKKIRRSVFLCRLTIITVIFTIGCVVFATSIGGVFQMMKMIFYRSNYWPLMMILLGIWIGEIGIDGAEALGA